jgi:hypothetical protein
MSIGRRLMRWVLWLVFVVLVVLSGCSGSPESSGEEATVESVAVSSSSTTEASTTTIAATTTSTAAPTATQPTTSTTTDVRYTVSGPEYQVASLPGSGGMYGSGCSPGPGTLPDGIWFGALADRSSEAVEFDLMCFGPGSEGPGHVSNNSKALRTVPVTENAIVYVFEGSGGDNWVLESYGQWLTHAADPAFCPEGCWVWLYVNAGSIIEMVELFFA